MVVTNNQIHKLRDDGIVAGDDLQIAICDVALTAWPEIAEVGEHRAALEMLGIYPALVDSDVVAQHVCARVIADAAKSEKVLARATHER